MTGRDAGRVTCSRGWLGGRGVRASARSHGRLASPRTLGKKGWAGRVSRAGDAYAGRSRDGRSATTEAARVGRSRRRRPSSIEDSRVAQGGGGRVSDPRRLAREEEEEERGAAR